MDSKRRSTFARAATRCLSSLSRSALFAVRSCSACFLTQLWPVAQGNALVADRLRSEQVGMNSYLTKPFRKEQLLAAIAKYLPEFAQQLRQSPRINSRPLFAASSGELAVIGSILSRILSQRLQVALRVQAARAVITLAAATQATARWRTNRVPHRPQRIAAARKQPPRRPRLSPARKRPPLLRCPPQFSAVRIPKPINQLRRCDSTATSISSARDTL